MVRLKADQERHDLVVLQVGTDVVRKGWSTVLVDLPGYAKPPVIGVYIPDIYARHGILEFIGEVETEDTNTAHSLGQHAAFRSWASQSPHRRFLVYMA